MKKLIILLTASLLATNSLYAQGKVKEYRALASFGADTVAYLKYNFEERKENYIGKPLAILLNELELPVKSSMSSTGKYGLVAYDEITLYFESDKITDYRKWEGGRAVSGDSQEMPEIEIEWQTLIPSKDVFEIGKRTRAYKDEWKPPANRNFFSSQIVGNVSVSGKNFWELPPVPDSLKEVVITPCCAPTPVVIPSESESVENAKVHQNFGILDIADCRRCTSDTVRETDSTKIATLYNLAKNTWQPKSIIAFNTMKALNYKTNFYTPKSDKVCPQYSKDTLYNGGVSRYQGFDAESKYFYRDSAYQGSARMNYENFAHKMVYLTIPASPTGSYRFTAPSGYDLYNYVQVPCRFYAGNNATVILSDLFSVAYDGSVYALHMTGETYAETIGTYTSTNVLANKIGGFANAKKHFLPRLPDNPSVEWGFIEGGWLQEAFVDCFRRLYNEGYGFSKEDAYAAALAYILEGRGIGLYKMAQGETAFKRYRTTPITDAQGKITGYNSIIY